MAVHILPPPTPMATSSALDNDYVITPSNHVVTPDEDPCWLVDVEDGAGDTDDGVGDGVGSEDSDDEGDHDDDDEDEDPTQDPSLNDHHKARNCRRPLPLLLGLFELGLTWLNSGMSIQSTVVYISHLFSGCSYCKYGSSL